MGSFGIEAWTDIGGEKSEGLPEGAQLALGLGVALDDTGLPGVFRCLVAAVILNHPNVPLTYPITASISISDFAFPATSDSLLGLDFLLLPSSEVRFHYCNPQLLQVSPSSVLRPDLPPGIQPAFPGPLLSVPT